MARALIPELNLRSTRVGGGLVDVGSEVSVPDEVKSVPRRLVLLIHGYQVPRDGAESTYQDFVELLHEHVSPEKLGTACGVHWPGDHPNELISMGTFSVRIPEATHAGTLLAQVLSELDAPEIVIIAHSLGCRLALSALLQMKLTGWYKGPPVRHAFLMAAAVPEAECDGAGRFAHNRTADAKQVVYFSEKDSVLKGPFPLGSELYQGIGGPAVGRSGGPGARWDERRWTGRDHGGYWDSDLVAQTILTDLVVWSAHADQARQSRKRLLGSIHIVERANGAVRTLHIRKIRSRRR